MASEKLQKVLTEIKNVVNASKAYDPQEGATAKYELLKSGKSLSDAIDDYSIDKIKLTEDQKDQIGMSFYEELFAILEN